MSQSLLLYSAIMLFGTLISSVSQVLLKKEAMREHSSKLKEYLNFPVVFAYCIFIVATLLTIISYRVVPLSFGPVLESTSYIYATVFGAIFFKERVTAGKVLALALIVAGIAVSAAGTMV